MDYTNTLHHLDEHGYAVVRNFLDRGTTAAIRAHMDGLMTPVAPPEQEGVNRVQVVRHPIPGKIMAELGTRPELLDLAQATLRIPPSDRHRTLRMLEQVLIRTDPQRKSRGPGGWHADMAFLPEHYESTPRRTYYHMVHACNTVKPGSGAFMIVPGSHHKTYAATAKLKTDEELTAFKAGAAKRAGVNLEEGIEVLAEEGDLIIFNPMALHSASANMGDEPRYVYFASFRHASSTWFRDQLIKTSYIVDFSKDFRENLPAGLQTLLEP